MRQIVHDLRKQPSHVRHQTAIFIALAISVIIAIIWLATFHLQPVKSSTVVKSSMEPFALVKDNIVQIYGAAAKGYDQATGDGDIVVDNNSDQ